MDHSPFGGNMTWFPAADDNLMVCSPAGRILFMTGSLRFQLDEDLVGRSLNDILPDSLAAQLIACAHGGQGHSFQGQLRGRAVRCSMEPREGNLLITVFFTEGEQKPAMALSAAELLSREISGSLATMFVAWDSLPGDRDPKTQYAKNVIRQGIYRLMRLSRNMLDCARAENGRLELNLRQGDLTAFCLDLCQRAAPFLEELEIPFAWELPQSPLSCLFDQEKLERVLLNLLTNSAKYTCPDNKIFLSLSVKGESAVIAVSDQGPGIPPAMLPYVFTRRQEGTASAGMTVGGAGYGFALAKAVMSLHGGACVVSSAEGQGATVTLTLPLEQTGGPLPLGSPPSDYASGFDHLLLELSPVLPPERYGKSR